MSTYSSYDYPAQHGHSRANSAYMPGYSPYMDAYDPPAYDYSYGDPALQQQQPHAPPHHAHYVPPHHHPHQDMSGYYNHPGSYHDPSVSRKRSSRRHEDPNLTYTAAPAASQRPVSLQHQRNYSDPGTSYTPSNGSGFSTSSLGSGGRVYEQDAAYYDGARQDEHDDDDEHMDESEREAQQNAERNKNIPIHHPEDGGAANGMNSAAGVAPPVAQQQAQQQQPSVEAAMHDAEALMTTPGQEPIFLATTQANGGENGETTRGKKGGAFLDQLRGAWTRLKKQGVRRPPTIQTMMVSTPLGQVMDEHQRQEVLSKLAPHGAVTPMQPINDDNAMRIARLEYIWVFQQAADHQQVVWTTFDYNNQAFLQEYEHQPEGISVRDSHIAQGNIPVQVFPSQGLCYYHLGSNVMTLHVRCMRNSRKVRFVYRFQGDNAPLTTMA